MSNGTNGGAVRWEMVIKIIAPLVMLGGLLYGIGWNAAENAQTRALLDRHIEEENRSRERHVDERVYRIEYEFLRKQLEGFAAELKEIKGVLRYQRER